MFTKAIAASAGSAPGAAWAILARMAAATMPEARQARNAPRLD
jgi:hypothetical protein